MISDIGYGERLTKMVMSLIYWSNPGEILKQL